MRGIRWALLTGLGATLLAGAPAEAAKPKARLARFTSCASLVRYAQVQAARTDVPVRAFPASPLVVSAPPQVERGGPQPVASPAAPASDGAGTGGPAEGDSGTNVQEVGVDEPDVIKADARRALVVANGRLHALDLTGPTPRDVSSLPLSGFGHQLLVRKDIALVITQDGQKVSITELDVANLAALRIKRTLEVPGGYVGARLTGGSARIVVSTPPAPTEPDQPTTVRTFVPRSVLRSRISGRTFRRAVAPCDQVRHPLVPAGPDLLSVLTFDLDRGLYSVDRDAVLGAAQAVYASTSSLYVATTTATGAATGVHRFDTTQADRTTYRSSGEVPGTVLNQFSLSEHKGDLRIASTIDGDEQGESESIVSVLRESGPRLVGIGRVGGLGRGERIYAVRFLGDVGYVVTFRQVDPLYTLDLAVPTAPKVLGELKIEGYSAYLHPAGEDLLIGVGIDATAEGRRTGAQVSLFDVSDLRAPKRLHATGLGQGSSTDVENDHHAFLWWGPSRLAVLPVRSEQNGFASVARGLRITRAGITPAGAVEHDAPGEGTGRADVERSVVAGGRVLTLSWAGLGTSRLDDLGGTAFTGFPEAPVREPGPIEGGPQPQPVPAEPGPQTAPAQPPPRPR